MNSQYKGYSRFFSSWKSVGIACGFTLFTSTGLRWQLLLLQVLFNFIMIDKDGDGDDDCNKVEMMNIEFGKSERGFIGCQKVNWKWWCPLITLIVREHPDKNPLPSFNDSSFRDTIFFQIVAIISATAFCLAEKRLIRAEGSFKTELQVCQRDKDHDKGGREDDNHYPQSELHRLKKLESQE